jgi:hypothetical protein
MITLELARKLKEAGLVWEPKKNDTYWNADSKKVTTVWRPWRMINPWYYVWLPSLSQLLAEIEGRGHCIFLSGPYFKQKEWRCKLEDENGPVDYKYSDFVGPNGPEEAAGLALLWVLENENKGVDR